MSRPVELPTRSVTCAGCGARHSNTALCDTCASHCAIAIDRHSEHDCGCTSCNIHRRALLALMDTDLRIYRLREVADARGLPSIDVDADRSDVDPSHSYIDDCGCEHCETHRAELDARCDEALAAFVVDVEGRVTDLESGELLGVVAPVVRSAEVA